MSTNAPLISVVQATEVNDTTATLRAVINPNGSDTTYRFEYGTDTSYGQSAPVPDGNLGEGNQLTAVTRSISNLSPDTVYHYRVSATNAAGSSQSEDHELHTYPSETEGGLPDNRAYEMVSPPDKNGSDVMANFHQTVSSVGGNAIIFSSKGAFAGAGGIGLLANYVAKRGPDGWSTTSLSPNQPPGRDFVPSLDDPSQYKGAFTPSLSKGIFLARTPLSDDPNVATIKNLYLRTDVLSGDGPNPEQGPTTSC